MNGDLPKIPPTIFSHASKLIVSCEDEDGDKDELDVDPEVDVDPDADVDPDVDVEP